MKGMLETQQFVGNMHVILLTLTHEALLHSRPPFIDKTGLN